MPLSYTRYLIYLLLALCCIGCAEPAEEAAEGAEAVGAEAVPGATVVQPADTLFQAYDDALFQPVHVDAAAARRWADSTLAAMTLDEKIGQLFIVDLPGLTLRERFSSRAREAIETYHVGGFLVPRLLTPPEVFERTQRLQRLSETPLFFAADYERGVGRFNNPFTELPSNMALGAAGDTVLAAAAGRLTAIESRAAGINLLFAPVVDVNNNPANPIINIRSYGENPEQVGEMAAAFVREAERHGVLTTLKHFPGHGDTSVDTHARMGVVEGDFAKLDSIELRPYQMVLGEVQPAGIMSAHLWIEALEEEPLPATFSRRALHDLLRDSLGFQGFVVTDDVKMGALQNEYSMEERIVRPLLAGADVILTPSNLGRAVAVVKEAVRSGRLSEERIDQSVRRILEAKASAGLHRDRFASEEAFDYLMAQPRGAALAEAIAERAVTLLKTAPVLPLEPDQEVVLLQLSNYTDSESIEAAMDTFAATLREDEYALEVRYDDEPSEAGIAELLEAAAEADLVVLVLYLRLQSGRGEAGLFPLQQRLVRRLLALDTPVALVTFGNPYAISTAEEAEALLVAYDQTIETVRTAARILRGEQRPRGTLPITISPYPYGSGLQRLTVGEAAGAVSAAGIE